MPLSSGIEGPWAGQHRLAYRRWGRGGGVRAAGFRMASRPSAHTKHRNRTRSLSNVHAEISVRLLASRDAGQRPARRVPRLRCTTCVPTCPQLPSIRASGGQSPSRSTNIAGLARKRETAGPRVSDLRLLWWPGAGSNRRPSDFQDFEGCPWGPAAYGFVLSRRAVRPVVSTWREAGVSKSVSKTRLRSLRAEPPESCWGC